MKNLCIACLIIGLFFSCKSKSADADSSIDDKEVRETFGEDEPIQLTDDGGQPVFREITVKKTHGDCANYPEQSCMDVVINYPQLINGTDSLSTSVEHIVMEYVSDFLATENTPKQSTIHSYLEDALKEKAAEISAGTTDYKDILALEVTIKPFYQNAVLSCMENNYYYNSGGAHPNSGAGFHILDNETGRLLTKEDIIDKDATFREKILIELKKQYDIPATSDISSQGFLVTDNEFAINNNIGVKSDSLFITYVPYEIAPYVMGYTELKFSKSDVEDYLLEEFLEKWDAE